MQAVAGLQKWDTCNSLHRMHGGHADALTHRNPHPSGFGGRRGEVVEDVAPPLPLATQLLLVKPPAGLATPAVFRALDLGARSAADPRALLSALAAGGSGAARRPSELCKLSMCSCAPRTSRLEVVQSPFAFVLF